jgi:hypothetical protein
VAGGLDEGEEHAVEAQLAACGTCWSQLQETITVSALLYEAAAAEVKARQHPAGRAFELRKVDAASGGASGHSCTSSRLRPHTGLAGGAMARRRPNQDCLAEQPQQGCRV